MRRIIALAMITWFAAPHFAANRTIQGFSYQHEELARGPQSIHIVKIDRSDPNLELHSTLPAGPRFGLVRLSSQVKAMRVPNGQVIAAINGDYYDHDSPYSGDPQGLQIMRGELISGPFDWTCFWLRPDGAPDMGIVESHFTATLPDGSLLPINLNERRDDDEAVLYSSVVGSKTHARGGLELTLEPGRIGATLPLRASAKYFLRVAAINREGNTPTATNQLVLSIGPKLAKKVRQPDPGDTLRISTLTTPSLKGVQTAIGGGPGILRDGKRIFPKQGRVRHPRSVVGWNDQHIFLVEVDGRQRDLSVGMTFDELCDYLLKINCPNAMCLDGGGSSTLWAFGQVMNNPCEGGERGSANGLAVIHKNAALLNASAPSETSKIASRSAKNPKPKPAPPNSASKPATSANTDSAPPTNPKEEPPRQ